MPTYNSSCGHLEVSSIESTGIKSDHLGGPVFLTICKFLVGPPKDQDLIKELPRNRLGRAQLDSTSSLNSRARPSVPPSRRHTFQGAHVKMMVSS